MRDEGGMPNWEERDRELRRAFYSDEPEEESSRPEIDRPGGNLLGQLVPTTVVDPDPLPSAPRAKIFFDREDDPGFSEERAQIMAALFACGDRTLVQLVSQEQVFPCLRTLYNWLEEHEAFRKLWDQAKRIRAQVLLDMRSTVVAWVQEERRKAADNGAITHARMVIQFLEGEAKALEVEGRSSSAGGSGSGEGALLIAVPADVKDPQEWARRWADRQKEA
jgi:hypothetical protein